MAEAFGVVASALAVTELSAKVIQLCGKYWGAVRHAKEDIDRVIKEVKSVKEVVDNLEILLKGTGGTKLSTSQKLRDALGECRSQLESLEGRLAPSSTRRLMNRFRINDLKWPFENEDVEKILQGLSRCTQSLTAALQIDQTGIVLEIDANVVTIDQNIVIGKLPIAEGAAFDSHAEEHNPTCLPNTRGQLLNDIYHWIEDSEAKPVFWLNGMAGTGKSTISRTLARHTYEKGQLGASFFFKRGEGGRGGASKFFTTITAQLVHQMPALTPHVKDAIDKSHNIFDKALEEQFKKLILEPLSKTHIPSSRAAALVIIIDALDECDPDQDVRQIIHILSGANSSASLRLRIFLTSRPELPIRLGFRQVEGKYQKLILHEIEESIVEHDLSVYFEYELARVKEKHNALRRDQQIPSVWPDRSEIQTLTTMAMPLFIFAATVCRFIGDQRNGYPDKKLRKVLEYQTKSLGSNLDATYLPVLDQLLTDLCDSDKDEVLRLFKHLVGPIVLLESPLSVSGLASLLGISQADIDSHLDLLHSVLNVPLSPSSPVRLFHLSFRDFLIDPSKRGKNPFWIDEKEAHKQLAADCIRLMSETLRRNICNLEWPGAVTDSVKPEIILDKLPLELQYACQYWTYHVQHADLTLHDDDQVHRFLQQHFLHWLEALSLIGKFSEGQQGFRELSSLLRSEGCSQLSLFIDQALQFMIKHFVKLNDAPLQSYYTPLARESEKSTLRASFHRDVPDWILIAKGHDKYVGSLAFSPDGTIIASRSYDQTVRLWSVATGECLHTLEGHTDWVITIAFSPDGTIVASGSTDQTVRLWSVATGKCLYTLEGHTDWVITIAFSPDGTIVASGSRDQTVRLWSVATGKCLYTLRGHTDWVITIAFSPDGTLIASGSYDRTVRLWSVATGECLYTLEGHTDAAMTIAFSPDGTIVASGSDKTVRLWSVATGDCLYTLEGHTTWVITIAFSPDGTIVASGSGDETVRLWSVATGKHLKTIECGDTVRKISLEQDNEHIITTTGIFVGSVWPQLAASLHTPSGISVPSVPPRSSDLFHRPNDVGSSLGWIYLNGRRWLFGQSGDLCASHDLSTLAFFDDGWNIIIIRIPAEHMRMSAPLASATIHE